MNASAPPHFSGVPIPRPSPWLWLVYGGVALLLCAFILIGYGAFAKTRILQATPLVAIARGEETVHYLGFEITHYPLCTPWAIGASLIMKCPPGTSNTSRPYLRLWHGQISYNPHTQEVQAQAARTLFVQRLP